MTINSRRIILALFCILLNIRMLTELPRVFRELNWASINVSDYDLNRAASTGILLFCALFILLKIKIRYPHRLPMIAVILLVFLVISFPLAIDTYLSVGMPFTGILVVMSRFMLEFFLLIFLYNYLKNPGDLALLTNAYFKTALFIIMSITLIQIFTSSFGEVQGVERLMGTFGSPNVLASFLHLYIFLTFYYSERKGLIFWITIGILYILLFYTGSITNLGANIVFMLLVGHHQKWFRKKMFYVAFPLLSILIFSAILYKWEAISRRLSTLLDLSNFQLAEASSISWRFEAWGYYISLLENNIIHWLFGMGISTQRFIFLNGYPNNLASTFEAPGTHNDYLAILIDFGIIGLIFFLYVLASIYYRIKKIELIDPRAFYFRLYFISLLVIMLTENCIDQLVTFVFLIALVILIKQESFFYEKKSIG